ncbi:MAG: T9SS type A sorting domain-containing protein [Chryseolinea sp.]
MAFKAFITSLFLLIARFGYCEEEIKLTLDTYQFCVSAESNFALYDVKGITFGATNDFILEMSDANGDFSVPVTLGTTTSNSPNGQIEMVFPPATAPGSGYLIRLRTTNPVRTSVPHATPIAIYSDPQVSTISASPDGEVCDDTKVTYSLNVTGGIPTDYTRRWEINNNASIFNTELITNMRNDGDIITVEIFATGCRANFTADKVVNVTTRPAVYISADPGPSICAPGTVSLSASVVDASATSYQWFRNSSPIAGANAPTHKINLTNPFTGSFYHCVVSFDGPACYPSSTETKTMKVDLYTPMNLEALITPPAKICDGLQSRFIAKYEWIDHFQWTKNDQPTGDDYYVYEDIFKVGDVIKLKVSTEYPCVDVSVKESEPFTVTEVDQVMAPQVVLHQSPEGDFLPGTPVVFTTETSGSGTGPLFQWYRNGQPATPSPFGGVGNDPELGGIFAVTPENGEEIKVVMRSTDLCATPVEVSDVTHISQTNDSYYTLKWQNDSEGPLNIKPDAFVIGNKAYVVSGRASYGSGTNPTDELWEYDIPTTTWTRKSRFGHLEERDRAAGFAADGKGFIGLGQGWNQSLKKDFWRYDPFANQWTSITTYPGSGSLDAFSIGVEKNGYVGMLSDADNFGDFWEYNAVNNQWKKLRDFPGPKREAMCGFAIDKKIYVGMGSNGTNFFRDFWEYDIEAKTWSARSSFPGEPHHDATSFAVGRTGYYGLGYDIQLKAAPAVWRYNPADDLWFVVEEFIPFNYGASLYKAVAVGLQDRAVVYSSRRQVSGVSWEFIPFAINGFEGSGFTNEPIKVAFASDLNFAQDNTFTVQISSDSLFANFITAGSLSSHATLGVIDALIPIAAVGIQYVRVASTSPAMATASLVREFIPVGFEESSYSIVQTYPNPVIDKLTISVPEHFLGIGSTFKILNAIGMEVITGSLESDKTVVDLEAQSAGLYLLYLNIDRTTITTKIVVN